jgi:hypothetical protein
MTPPPEIQGEIEGILLIAAISAGAGYLLAYARYAADSKSEQIRRAKENRRLMRKFRRKGDQ